MSNIILFNRWGDLIKTEDVHMADHLIASKQKHGKNCWPVVEEIIKVWQKKCPSEYKSFLFELEEVRETRANKHAASKTEMYRYTLDIPEFVWYIFRKLYPIDELVVDKNFMRRWAQKFPFMTVAGHTNNGPTSFSFSTD